MEDWLKCQISPLVKYRQNQNQNYQNVVKLQQVCVDPSMFANAFVDVRFI